MRLSLNENAFGPSPQVLSVIQREFSRLNRYADDTMAQRFVEQVSAYERIPVERVVLGEILGFLGLYLGSHGGPGGEFLYSTPGYLALIEAAANRQRRTHRRCPPHPHTAEAPRSHEDRCRQHEPASLRRVDLVSMIRSHLDYGLMRVAAHPRSLPLSDCAAVKKHAPQTATAAMRRRLELSRKRYRDALRSLSQLSWWIEFQGRPSHQRSHAAW
jgi:hypothetical protein